jgi:hypothetical protein
LEARATEGVVRVSEQENIEEGFGELFKAARVLLREGITEEDQIFPTLAFAFRTVGGRDPDLDPRDPDPLDHLDYDYKRLVKEEGCETWEREADRFVSLYGSLRPVQIIDDILILKMLPVGITICNDFGTETPREVHITVYSRRQSPNPENVASLYEERLSDANIPHGEVYTGGMRFGFHSDFFLDITIERAKFWVASEGPGISWETKDAHFPHPQIVKEFFRILLKAPFGGDGFDRHLGIRSRGGAPKAANLIPACVAFYLRNAGKIQCHPEIHRLLNEYVLYEIPWKTKLPEDGVSSSEETQLWRDVRDESKVGNPLKAVGHTRYWQGRG